MTQRHIQTPIMHRVVVNNGCAFIGGTVADDMSLGLEEQTEQILAKFDEYLGVAGTDKTRLLSATIFLTDLSRKAEMDRAWKRWLDPKHFPARATVGVADLGEGTLIEITITAAC